MRRNIETYRFFIVHGKKLLQGCGLAWLVLLPCVCWGQMSFRNPLIFNQLDGIVDERVLCLAEDEEGFMWAGTQSGVSRIDGLEAKNFVHLPGDSSTIHSNYVGQLLADSVNHRIWIGTSLGLSYYDLQDKQIHNYYAHPGDPHSVPDHQVWALYQDRQGQVWIGFKFSGVLRYRPETDDFIRYLCAAEAENNCEITGAVIQQDLSQDHIYWLGTNEGIVRLNAQNGQWQQFIYETADSKVREYANAPTAMLLHPNGLIYLGTWYVGLFTFDTKSLRYEAVNPVYQNETAPFTEADKTNSFYLQDPEHLWINSQRGLQLFHISTETIIESHLNTDQEWFSIEHLDQQNRIWSATRINGVYIYNPLMQQYPLLQYEPQDLMAITRRTLLSEDERFLFVASQQASGLWIWDRQTDQWELIPLPDGRKDAVLTDLAYLDEETLLVLESRHLYQYRLGTSSLEKYPLQPDTDFPRLQNILKDREGTFWISSFLGGWMRLDHAGKRLHNFRTELEKIWPLALGGDRMVEDKNGNIWLREHSGLLIFDRKNQDFIYHPYTSDKPKAQRGMSWMTTDPEGGVWIAANRNILGYGHADSLEQGMFRTFDYQTGLIGDAYQVHRYGSDILIFSRQGVQRYNWEKKRWGAFYDREYGLPYTITSISQLKDGRLIGGQRKAITIFHPDSLQTNQEAPHPYISSFHIFDTAYPLNKAIGQTDSIFLSYAQNFFSFDFSAIGYNLPEETRFRYQLEGFDQDWQDGTARRFAAYTNVPGGHYRFMVEAINSEGIASPQPSITYVYISTVWYKRLWFWAAVIAFFLIIGWLLYREKIARVRKEERLRNDYERKLADVELSALRAQMNPHFIFNSLNSIEYYIINNEPEKASDYLNRFSRLIRLILQNSKSTTVPLKDDLSALRLYMEMESMRFDQLFDYEVQIETGLDMEQIFVPPMLLQPYVENAIWHGLLQNKGKKGRLDIRIHQEDGHLHCRIEDNGIGREAAQQIKSKSATPRKSYGMKITSERLSMLNHLAGANAFVKVTDLYDENGAAAGTRVELSIPL
ncbi:MAG: histidine kinase [Bacteroidota bacterium]